MVNPFALDVLAAEYKKHVDALFSNEYFVASSKKDAIGALIKAFSDEASNLNNSPSAEGYLNGDILKRNDFYRDVERFKSDLRNVTEDEDTRYKWMMEATLSKMKLIEVLLKDIGVVVSVGKNIIFYDERGMEILVLELASKPTVIDTNK